MFNLHFAFAATNEVIDPEKARAWEINQSTGGFIHNYPLAIPPGRNNLQPDLKLTYSTDNSEPNGIFGKQWSLSIPYIERENKHGVNYLYSAAFSPFFASTLDGELATTTVTSVYAALIENGSFNTYTVSTSDKWVVKDKNGTQYTFGSTTSTRMDDPNNSSNIYRWMLAEVRDTNDNYIRYTYYKDAGQIYPDSILYTGNGSTDGIFEIDFLRENRTDTATSYDVGFRAVTNSRTTEIDVKVNGTLVRKYALGYGTAANGLTSLLSSITETGYDEASNAVALPATMFTYKSDTPGFTTDSTYNLPVAIVDNGTQKPRRFIDFSGDGLTDILRGNYVPGVGQFFDNWINNGHGWDRAGSEWNVLLSTSDVDNRAEVVDINCDHRPDYVNSTFDGSTTSYESLLNTPNGWTGDQSNWHLPLALTKNGVRRIVKFIDFTGDGCNDIMHGDYVPGVGQTYSNWVNTGNGWIPADPAWNFLFSTSDADQGYKFFYLNPDKLPDVLWSNFNGSTTSYGTYINTGYGWEGAPLYISPVTFLINGVDRGHKPVDLNHDGLTDIFYGNYNPVTMQYTYDNYLNTGSGWIGAGSAWNFTLLYGGAEQGYRIGDFDGDSGADIEYSNFNGSSTSYGSSINNDLMVDLLVQISYPAGGKTNIQYKQAAAYFDGWNNLTNTTVPFFVPTVYKVSTNDGTTTSTQDTFSYKGGKFQFYSATDRKFAGFAEVDKTDSASSVTKTFYHTGSGTDSTHGEYQDNYWKMGKAYRVEKYDRSGNLFEKTINKWDTATSTTSVAGFAKLSQTIRSTYDGYSSHKDKAESFTYDNLNGNLTQKIEWGEVSGSDDGTLTDTSTDKFITDITYASSPTSSVRVAVSQSTVSDQATSTVKQARFYYDSLASGIVDKGNQTKEENWVTSTTYISRQTSYNSYGLVATSTDPRGKITSYIYDGFNLYQATTTQPLSLVSQSTYNYANGKTATSTDPNGNKFANVYDGFGRSVFAKQPDPSATTTLLTKTAYSYNDATSTVSVLQTDYLDSTTTIKTYTYYDGLKRAKQARRSAEDGYYETKDISYNNIGLVQQESLPYFSSGASSTTATTIPALFTTYAYDALQRVKTGANAVGTTTKAYINWKIIITDPNGKKKDLKYDAYGNLIEVTEHHTAGGSSESLMSLLDPEYAALLMKPLMALADETATTVIDTVMPSASPDPTSSPEPSASPPPSLSPSPTPSAEPSEPPTPSPSVEPTPSLSPVVSPSEASPETFSDSATPPSIAASPTPSPEPTDIVTPEIDPQTVTSSKPAETLDWNSKTETLESGARRYEVHVKQVNFKNADGAFKPIDVTPVPTADGWEITQNTFIARFPARSAGIAEMVNNNRFDTRDKTDIDEPIQTMTIHAEGVADVTGALEFGDVGYGDEWYVRYPNAYADIGADLIYVVWHGRIPRLQKLVRFNSALASDKEFSFTYAYSDDPDFTTKEGAWDKKSEFRTSQAVKVGKEGQKRGFAFKNFLIWDMHAMTRKFAPVEVDIKSVDTNSYLLTKHIQSSFFSDVVYPVYTDTTNTFYPDYDPETTTVDGGVATQGGAAGTFASVRAKAGTLAQPSSGENTAVQILATGSSNQYNEMFRGYTLFDTSGIGSGQVVTTATLSLWVADKGANGMGQSITIVQGVPASNTDLVAADYATANFTMTQQNTTDLAWASITLSAYNDFVLNATGRGNINTTGITKFGIVSDLDRDNGTPTWSSGANAYFNIRWADQAGFTNDPKLMVDSSSATAPIAPTNLLAEGLTNPTGVTDATPEFSAIYNDPQVGDQAIYYRLQVSASSTDWATLMWDSAKTAMATTTQGNRSPDITYGGTPLSLDGSGYYWRIKFWDVSDAEGQYSTSTASFTLIDDTVRTTYVYNGLGALTKITDALGNVRNFTYDGLGRRLTAQDLHGSSDTTYGTWTYAYDDGGNLTQVLDPKSQTINRTYDDINRVLTEDYTGQTGTEVAYTYDSCTQGLGRLCTASSSAVSATSTYNVLGQLTQESKTISGTSTPFVTAYTYDRQGNQLTITNPDNSVVRYMYNVGGRIETVQRRESTTSTYSDVVTDFDYSPIGKVSFQANANCTQTTNTYDPAQLYRLTNKYTANSCLSGTGTFGFSSIAASNSFWATGNIGSDGEDYRPVQNGTVTSISFYGNSWSGNPGGQTTLQVSIYNAAGTLISSGATTINSTVEWKTIPVTSVPVYANTIYRLAFSPANWIIRYYEATGKNSDLQVATSYPTLPNPITWVTQAGKDKFSMYANYVPVVTVIQNISYTYDAVGNITRIVNASPTDASSTATFVYDDLYRLTSAAVTSTPTSVSGFTQTYTYDSLGNITNKSDLGDYTYATASTVGYANPDAAITIATSTLTYDNNGNVTSVSAIKFWWDYVNRLTRTGIGSSTSTYAYDPWGQRIKYTVATSTSATTTSYFPTKFYNITSGTPTSTKHIFANGELIATISGSATSARVSYVHTDHLAGSNVITNSYASVAELLDYYPYGSSRLDQQTNVNEQRKFIGQEYDAPTNLSYLNARYYDGVKAKFLSQDPSFLAIGDLRQVKELTGQELQNYLADPQQLNSYSYARNNPIRYVDANGRATYEVGFNISILALGFGGGVRLEPGVGWQYFSDFPSAGASFGGSVKYDPVGKLEQPNVFGGPTQVKAEFTAATPFGGKSWSFEGDDNHPFRLPKETEARAYGLELGASYSFTRSGPIHPSVLRKSQIPNQPTISASNGSTAPQVSNQSYNSSAIGQAFYNLYKAIEAKINAIAQQRNTTQRSAK